MKKYLVVLAALALVFASCNPKEEEEKSALTGISFKQAEVSLMVGDTVQLALLGTPAGVEIPATVVFASSNEEVVKVIDNKVNIVGVGSGEANITAKVGELSAVCKVTVRIYEEIWDVDWLYYFPDSKSELPLNDSIYDIEGYKCRLHSVTYFCPNTIDFDENLTAGEGFCIFADVAALFLDDEKAGANNGEMVARQFTVVDNEEDYKTKPFSVMAGKMDPAIIGPVWQEYFEARDAGNTSAEPDLDTYLTGVKGAHIASAEIKADGSISYSLVWDGGMLVSGWAARLVNEAQEYYIDYDFNAQWCYGFWGLGLATNWDAETYSDVLVKPYALELSGVWNYKAGQLGKLLETPKAPGKNLANEIKNISKNKKYWKNAGMPAKAVRISELKK